VQLAAYVDHQLPASSREIVGDHVADCEFCLNQVAFLSQAGDWADAEMVPARLLGRARDLAPQKAGMTAWGWRWPAATTAAACLLLVFALIALRFWKDPRANVPSEPLVAQQHPEMVPAPPATPAILSHNPVPSPGKLRSPEPVAPEIRSQAHNPSPTMIFPRYGARVRRSELDFRWEPFPDAAFYDITVATAEGNLVLETKTEDTHLRIPDDIQLQPGAKYFVSMRAYLRQGKTVKSSIVSFSVSAP
jgi:hypothetical protein